MIHNYYYFLGLYTKCIRNAFQTIPVKVSADGHHLSHDVTSFHKDLHDKVHFSLEIDGKRHLLVLQPDKSVLGPAIIIERRRENIHTRSSPLYESTTCHFQGIVYGLPNSKVALSACNGLVSFFYEQRSLEWEFF